MKALFARYDTIYEKLNEALETGNLSALSYGAIIRLIHRVANKLTANHENIHKKVGDIMGGKVLDLPEIRIYHQGIDKGREEGEAERKILEAERKSLENEVAKLRKELEALRKDRKE